MSSTIPESENKDEKESGTSTIVWVVFGIVVAIFLLLAGYYFVKARRKGATNISVKPLLQQQKGATNVSVNPLLQQQKGVTNVSVKPLLQQQKGVTNVSVNPLSQVRLNPQSSLQMSKKIQQQKSTKMQMGMVRYLQSQGRDTEAANLLNRILPSPPKK